jgi:hypothetical protein
LSNEYEDVLEPWGGDDESGTAEGAGISSAVGGVGGLLAGLGAFAIPGIGPVVGAGWLAATLIGAAAGGVAGGLIGSLRMQACMNATRMFMPKEYAAGALSSPPLSMTRILTQLPPFWARAQ